jgi:hypothetical protein
MRPPTRVTLVPLAAGLHLRWPRFNAATLASLLRREAPDALALEPLRPGFDDDPAWQDCEELLLPMAAVPWCTRAGVQAQGVHEPSPEPGAAADLQRYLEGYPAARAALDAVAVLQRSLGELLADSLTLPRVLDEAVPLLAADRAARLEAFGDGPATDWAEERSARAAERIVAIDARHVVVLVALDRYASLRDALIELGVEPRRPSAPPEDGAAQERSRARALLDLAWRGEAEDVGAVLAELRRLGHAEARYHAAGLLLGHGHPAEALEELEGALRLDFAQPYFLPGSLLARLGQLRDVAGHRSPALQAYRGVLALSWAPSEAVAAAREGLVRPFVLPTAGAGGGRAG